MKRILFTSILLVLTIQAFNGQNPTDSLTQKLSKIQDLGYLPGFAVSIVSDKGIHYQKGFGYSDTLTKKPFTVNSIQNIGSISKTLTGIALMKLIEEGKLKWNTPINDILPFRIYNPYHPKVPITVEHLATHTSTLTDPWDYERTYLFSEKINLTKKQLPKDYRKLVPLYNQNTNIPVPEFIENMVHPLGKWYKKKNYTKKKPGTTYEYSNLGATVAGYIVELISGKSYTEYTKELILKPLKMDNSGWSHSEIDMDQFVTLYLSNDQKIPNYSLISYADGGLISSVNDLSLFFSEMIREYKTGVSVIFKNSSIRELMNASFTSEEKNSGRFWAINNKGEIGHSGGDPGIMAFMMFDPKTSIGRIIMTNKSDNEGNGINQLVYAWKTMEEFAPRIVLEEKLD